jgi:hypothetical protein
MLPGRWDEGRGPIAGDESRVFYLEPAIAAPALGAIRSLPPENYHIEVVGPEGGPLLVAGQRIADLLAGAPEG